jgi:hypothetical protein
VDKDTINFDFTSDLGIKKTSCLFVFFAIFQHTLFKKLGNEGVAEEVYLRATEGAFINLPVCTGFLMSYRCMK